MTSICRCCTLKSKVLSLEQLSHFLETLLDCLGEPPGAGGFAGEEGADSKDNVLVLEIVGDSVAIRDYRTIAHIRIGEVDGNLQNNHKLYGIWIVNVP